MPDQKQYKVKFTAEIIITTDKPISMADMNAEMEEDGTLMHNINLHLACTGLEIYEPEPVQTEMDMS